MKKWFVFSLVYFFALTIQAAPLPAKDVFQFTLKKIDPNTFSLNWQIKPGYFLYSDRITLKTASNANVQLGPLRLPSPQTKTDKQDHSNTVYRNELSIPVSVLGNKPGETIIQLGYQGCADDGFCYPPEKKRIKLTIDSQLGLSALSLESEGNIEKTQDNKITKLFDTHNWVMILLTFFGFGLLLSFTPCILPMVPVLSGIIIGHGKQVTTKKAFFLSLSYVLSMSLTYALVGAVVAMLGSNLQISMQSPWAISVLSLIFILLALSMFGFYEFKLPNAWQSKIVGPDSAHRGGHYLGAALMGCLSTLILSPCVTAPLIGVLTYIAQTGNILLGSVTLFVLSLGMGTPLLLIGTSAGKWLPRSGDWMNTVKAFFGIMLLAVAIYLMSRIIPASVTMGLWASLLIFSGIFAGAFTHSISHKEKFYQGIGIILLVYGLLILIGASLGATNPLQPLAASQITSQQQIAIPASSQRTQTLANIKQAIAQAKGKPVMLDFYADWCASCKVMEATTLKDAQVQNALSQFVVITVDVTENTSQNKEIMGYFQIVAPPTYVFFDAESTLLSALTLVGETTPSEFLEALHLVN
jgi:thiol:disulfide interchange protein DsbD